MINILILGGQDRATYLTVDYLRKFSSRYCVINQYQKFDSAVFEICSSGKHVILEYDGVTIDSRNVFAYWNRRGVLQGHYTISFNEQLHEIPKSAISTHLSLENKVFLTALVEVFNGLPVTIEAFDKGKIEKLEQLEVASKCGLEVPDTYIVSSKSELISLIDRHSEVISKSINRGFLAITKDGDARVMYTNLITPESLSKIPDQFVPTLFQACQRKKYELKIFYINSVAYPMAIFSQNDANTSIDFRRGSHTVTPRTVPFNIPAEIKKNIGLMMSSLNLNTGTIDMIVTTEGKFIFIEVNGQAELEMISPCNYFIERHIAQTLSCRIE